MVSKRRLNKGQHLDKSITALPHLSRAELLVMWSEACSRSAPKGISRRLLEHAAAYHLQTKALGGFSNATKRKLLRIAATDGKQQSKPLDPQVRLAPGTRLVRQWHGRTYTVDVLEKGYLYAGQTYRSLSEIARTITGTRWSGPRFFAL